MTRKKRMCKRLWSMLIIVALLMANVCGDFRTLRVEAEIDVYKRQRALTAR